MHSFQDEGYNAQAFALKADLFKAFDCLNWEYLSLLLMEYGFPAHLCKIIMSCVTNSTFSIKLNGCNGGGFITPRRGLRQGCPLSPYLFILAMEPLSRLLTDAQVKGDLRGVVLAPGAPPLTHCLYADDVILFGRAEDREAKELADIMNLFGMLSGLTINNENFVAWFSHHTGRKEKRGVLRFLPAAEPTDTTVYLGYPVPAGRVRCKHYIHLIEKLLRKLKVENGKVIPGGEANSY
jgi:Reverse transcriptase (RNA-dependent DNA polymerase)